jgi:hypothetical protein
VYQTLAGAGAGTGSTAAMGAVAWIDGLDEVVQLLGQDAAKGQFSE